MVGKHFTNNSKMRRRRCKINTPRGQRTLAAGQSARASTIVRSGPQVRPPSALFRITCAVERELNGIWKDVNESLWDLNRDCWRRQKANIPANCEVLPVRRVTAGACLWACDNVWVHACAVKFGSMMCASMLDTLVFECRYVHVACFCASKLSVGGGEVQQVCSCAIFIPGCISMYARACAGMRASCLCIPHALHQPRPAPAPACTSPDLHQPWHARLCACVSNQIVLAVEVSATKLAPLGKGQKNVVACIH